jgi:hypothetical protein
MAGTPVIAAPVNDAVPVWDDPRPVFRSSDRLFPPNAMAGADRFDDSALPPRSFEVDLDMVEKLVRHPAFQLTDRWHADTYEWALTRPAPQMSPMMRALMLGAYTSAVGVVAAALLAMWRVRRQAAAEDDAGRSDAAIRATVGGRGLYPTPTGRGDTRRFLSIAEAIDGAAMTNRPEPQLRRQSEPAIDPARLTAAVERLLRSQPGEADAEVRRRAHAALDYLDGEALREAAERLNDRVLDALHRASASPVSAGSRRR